MVQSDIFVITYDADPDTLGIARHFATSKYHMLLFQSITGCFLAIYPHRKVANFQFINGRGFAIYIPESYTEFYVAVGKTYEMYQPDIDSIMRWENAKKLWILGESVVTLGIQKSVERDNKLMQLEEIFFHVTNYTYERLIASHFMGGLISLKEATFHRSNDLTGDQFGLFVKNQGSVRGWKCVEHEHVQYKCKKSEQR